jgi:hypothetical protein
VAGIVEDAAQSAGWIATALNSSGYSADFSANSMAEVDRFFDEHAKNGVPRKGGLLATDRGPRLFAAGAYVGEVLRRALGGEWQPVHSQCGDCGKERFTLRVDAEEGCAQRTCTSCGSWTLMLDSKDTVDDAALGDVWCACGKDVFEVGVGYSPRDDGNVRWVYLGIRCVADDVLGSCADWSIDYTPSEHLYDTA